jgi:ferredoxin--NADP+ reductase
VLVHGVRRARDLVYRAELEELGHEDPTFAYAPVVSREPAEAWSGLRGRVQAVLEDGTWQTVSDVPLTAESTHVFLCGNPDMIRDVGERLAGRGFRPDHAGAPGNLHYERYW